MKEAVELQPLGENSGKRAVLIGGGAVLGWELLLRLRESMDRWQAYSAALKEARGRGKPLLVIGCPQSHAISHPCGDVCLDIDSLRLARCQAESPMVGDIRKMTFPDKSFGAALCSHVLEHLSLEDARRALSELQRVAEVVYVCSPTRPSLVNWLYPEHQLWVDQLPDGRVQLEPRERSEWAKGTAGRDFERMEALLLTVGATVGLCYLKARRQPGSRWAPAQPGDREV